MSMKTVLPAVTAVVLLIVLLLAKSNRRSEPRSSTVKTATDSPEEGTDPSFLYGRVRTVDGSTYEGRLRWGGEQEAFWGDYFNGVRKENPWVAQVPPGRLPKRSEPVEVFGIEIARRELPIEPGRLFLMRFGDLARVEARGADVLVTLKSGTTFVLARSEASDFDDGVRIWDLDRGVVDLDSLLIQSIEFLDPPAQRAAPPDRLFAKVHASVGDFTGFVQWERDQCLGSDELVIGDVKLRFDFIRSIQRQAGESVEATLVDGRKATFSRGVLAGRGIYVDDSRYGRVLVSREAFQDVEFNSTVPAGPGYGDFRKGGPLTGTVTTRDGRRLTGRLVYDLDESESTETLDAPSQGVNFNIPFGAIASIALPAAEQRRAQRATVTLRSGESIDLECSGDLGAGNAGVLVFADGTPQQPAYVPWSEVERILLHPRR
jgi:hypothetical protein